MTSNLCAPPGSPGSALWHTNNVRSCPENCPVIKTYSLHATGNQRVCSFPCETWVSSSYRDNFWVSRSIVSVFRCPPHPTPPHQRLLALRRPASLWLGGISPASPSVLCGVQQDRRDPPRLGRWRICGCSLQSAPPTPVCFNQLCLPKSFSGGDGSARSPAQTGQGHAGGGGAEGGGGTRLHAFNTYFIPYFQQPESPFV